MKKMYSELFRFILSTAAEIQCRTSVVLSDYCLISYTVWNLQGENMMTGRIALIRFYMKLFASYSFEERKTGLKVLYK